MSWLDPGHIAANGDLIMAIQSILIEVDGKRIVVDTGVGRHVRPSLETLLPPQDTFLNDLTAAGFAPVDVDIVICTHLHVDHVGWNIRNDGTGLRPTFPHAEYFFVDEALEDFRNRTGSDALMYGLRASVEKIIEAGQARVVPSNHIITPSVRLVPTGGHTIGHVSVAISSAGQQALITGDMCHHPVQFAEPHWHNASDLDPAQSTATRRQVIDELADTDTMIIGTHFADPVVGWLRWGPYGCQLVFSDSVQ